jgi:t-SNARE complex subunit (syntaxin)
MVEKHHQNTNKVARMVAGLPRLIRLMHETGAKNAPSSDVKTRQVRM